MLNTARTKYVEKQFMCVFPYARNCVYVYMNMCACVYKRMRALILSVKAFCKGHKSSVRPGLCVFVCVYVAFTDSDVLIILTIHIQFLRKPLDITILEVNMKFHSRLFSPGFTRSVW